MNQTQKRLQIINIAISITDIETIQLQMLKLSSLRSDTKLKEILDGLQAQNYAQTQALITKYIETPTEEIVQRTSQNDQEVIEEFDLFLTTPEEESTELFDFNSQSKQTPQKSVKKQDIDFDNLLNLTVDDVMPDNIKLDISHTSKDTFFETPSEDTHDTKKSHIDTAFIPKDTFFDNLEEAGPSNTDTTVSTQAEEEDTLFENLLAEEDVLETQQNTDKEMLFETYAQEKEDTDKRREENETFFKEKVSKEEITAAKEISDTECDISTDEEKSLVYKNIPYIDQKLKNMQTQYPPLLAAQENYTTVNNWLLKISNEGYSEKEVEEVISHVGKLKENNAVAEAAQLLLISGATESKYAQFILARELFKGEILEKNLPEAFTLINRLAMDDDYPEAICDLAQFFENGIGIDKDKKRAEMLYKEAMELGVKRAAAHYERLHSANKSLFGKLFGK